MNACNKVNLNDSGSKNNLATWCQAYLSISIHLYIYLSVCPSIERNLSDSIGPFYDLSIHIHYHQFCRNFELYIDPNQCRSSLSKLRIFKDWPHGNSFEDLSPFGWSHLSMFLFQKSSRNTTKWWCPENVGTRSSIIHNKFGFSMNLPFIPLVIKHGWKIHYKWRSSS